MKNKYYTPSIEEFHVGFRFRVKHLHDDMISKSWRYEVFEGYELLGYIKEGVDTKEVTVKYLDKADIEELGWNINEWRLIKGLGEVRIRLHPMFEYNHLITIERKDYYRDASGNYTIIPLLSRAVVKNYNELKKIMQMLNIK